MNLTQEERQYIDLMGDLGEGERTYQQVISHLSRKGVKETEAAHIIQYFNENYFKFVKELNDYRKQVKTLTYMNKLLAWSGTINFTNAEKEKPHFIERRSNLSRTEFYDNYYYQNRPVIISNAFDYQALQKKWTPEYLKREFGQYEIPVYYSGDGPWVWQKMPLPDYVDIVTSGNNDYYTSINIIDQNFHAPYMQLVMGLLSQVQFHTDIMDIAGFSRYTGLWYGPGGSDAGCHQDPYNLMLMQVTGRKRAQLISPNQTQHLQGCIENFYIGQKGLMFLDKMDRQTYPGLNECKILDFILHAGEMLFIPIGWWHEFTSLEQSIGFTLSAFKDDNNYPTDAFTSGYLEKI